MYEYLSGRLKQLGIRQMDLTGVLGLKPASISHRFTGRTDWSLHEMYKLMEVCRADMSELHIYFPPPDVGQKRASWHHLNGA